jgi:uncharacterized protein
MSTIVITGGNGLIGRHITRLLLQKGHRVFHLGRTIRQIEGVQSFSWDLKNKLIDAGCLEQADHIIHLAGTGIADERWTVNRKNEIINSRVETANLIFDYLSKNKNNVRSFISASATGIYGNRGNDLLTEESVTAHDFLATTCKLWEKAASRFEEQNKRVVKLRLGVVLDKEGGALPKLAQPMKFFIHPILGNGNQIYSWVHINDVARAFIFAVENEKMNGVYNIAAPNPVDYKTFSLALAKALHKITLTVPAPKFLLNIMLGEMASTVTGSANVSSEKIRKAGFVFEFEKLEDALKNIYP